MTNKTTESSQGDGGGKPQQQQQAQDQTQPQPQTGSPAAPVPPDQLKSRSSNKVYKSGYLFLSSRGIGWTSWKKRWFILTRTSLVFFRSDPNAIPQRGGEVNLTLGGIDLNSSGSVVVKADKKLLTVLFPNGRDGRAFTLKAETLEDLNEWKTALEEALSNAPSAALVTGQNGVLKNDQSDAANGSAEQTKDKKPVKSLVIGRPILLALEDMDGTPSFLEKSLRFIEDHGVKVEGILRQAADVDDVEQRIRDYEHGNTDFSPEEDAHVIADCVKYVLRELPSSPVPASCCNALLEAYRTDRSTRVNAMQNAICETFPEPNRRLLQRILMMMQTVASHKADNRMSISAVAACMAPLLLRPLLAGDCESEHGFDMGGDGSVQLLQAAAAANHAQAIVITLLEEYDKLFGEGSVSPELYTESEDSGTETEELTDDDEDYDDDEYDDFTESSNEEDEETENSSSGAQSESSHIEENDLHDDKSGSKPSKTIDFESPQPSVVQHDRVRRSNVFSSQRTERASRETNESGGSSADNPANESLMHESENSNSSPSNQKSATLLNGPVHSVRRAAIWGRTPARKNLSMESIEIPSDDETEVQRLEDTKIDLQNKIAEEVKGNAVLHENLEKRKEALHERRLALEQEVARLQEKLQKEKELRFILESGLNLCQWPFPVSAIIDDKMKADIEEVARAEADVKNLKQKVDDLGVKLTKQRELNQGCLQDSSDQSQQTFNQQAKMKDRQKGFEITATSPALEMSRRSKSAHVDKTEMDVDKKLEAPPLPIKLSHQQVHSARNAKSSGVNTYSTSKKSGARGEGANSTTSALSKLTNRLYFLKERRTQIANELRNIDKGRNSIQSAQNNSQQSMGSEGSSSETSNDLDKGVAAEGLSVQNINAEMGRSEDHFAHLNRGYSESNYTADKGRSMRTLSR